jgi:hypothetical protein
MDQAAQSRRIWWRFSLRELLLVMLTVGAVLGWASLLYQQYNEFEPTDFFIDNSNWSDEVSEVLSALEMAKPGYGARTESYGNGPSACHRIIHHKLPLPNGSPRFSNVKRLAFLDAFQQQVQDKLAKGNCTVKQSVGGSIGDGDARVLGYRRGAVAGTVHIWIYASGENEARLIITMHEEQGPHRDVNIGVMLVGE